MCFLRILLKTLCRLNGYVRSIGLRTEESHKNPEKIAGSIVEIWTRNLEKKAKPGNQMRLKQVQDKNQL
jgi:hypothetical protein